MPDPEYIEPGQVLRFIGGPADGKFLNCSFRGQCFSVQWDTSMYRREGMTLIWQEDARVRAV